MRFCVSDQAKFVWVVLLDLQCFPKTCTTTLINHFQRCFQKPSSQRILRMVFCLQIFELGDDFQERDRRCRSSPRRSEVTQSAETELWQHHLAFSSPWAVRYRYHLPSASTLLHRAISWDLLLQASFPIFKDIQTRDQPAWESPLQVAPFFSTHQWHSYSKLDCSRPLHLV